mmetsp:Transcript_1398/g.2915  ORF Transcript_1398/g.2915 Transcript_1398/m.2915 type:complete len:386 (-) Transcript_1398:257-1414(-)
MLKGTEYKLEDSNVENIGSDMDKAARNAAAMTECEWEGAGKAVGIEIWRVENRRTESDVAQFGIKRVPRQFYRQFYRGDSYIVLNTYKDKGDGSLRWDIHFWIGSKSTADEYGVAAYKTVELDDLLGGAPVQYRECEGQESALFLSYFADGGPCPGGVRYLEGGIASGFRAAETRDARAPRLLHVRREQRTVKAAEVPVALGSINEGDCFVLDSEGKVFIYRGPQSDPFEKNKAAAVAQELADASLGRSKVVDAFDDDAFWALLGAAPGCAVAPPVPPAPPVDRERAGTVSLYSLDDALQEFVLVAQGPLQRSQLRRDDVMLVHTDSRVYVVIGPDAPGQEKASAMFKAQSFLHSKGAPPNTSITRLLHGQDAQAGPLWAACFAG